MSGCEVGSSVRSRTSPVAAPVTTSWPKFQIGSWIRRCLRSVSITGVRAANAARPKVAELPGVRAKATPAESEIITVAEAESWSATDTDRNAR